MNWTRVNRIVSICVFGYALTLYVLTVAPTASFWDAGEFIAIAHGLQVSHPPGAPFYMLVGRLFSMFVPQGLISLSVNMVSVLSSAFTILLTYWIIVRLVREFMREKPHEHVLAIVGGIVGACTFAVTDSFWFNAVEAEVYAMSMLFTALVVWLIMRWSERARQELAETHDRFGLGANRYLVLAAYLFGLAIGVHLLSLLSLFFIALIFFFTEYDRPEWTTEGRPDWRSPKRWGGILVALTIAALAFGVVYPGIVQKLPDWAGSTGTPLLALFGVVLLIIILVWVTQVRGMQVPNLAALSLLMVLLGYSSYAVIFIRSAADPPIDENDPETPAAIVSYLKREQYGDIQLLKGPNFNDRTKQFDENNIKNFPRRYSPSPVHTRFYAQYDSDWEFFWKYQVGHMYVRYFLWNFSGRESDIEDARAITGLAFLEGPYENLLQTPSERASRNRYFALPLLLGLFGMMYHFGRDWRRAFSVLVLFLVTGLGIIIYLNQTPMQPRERDYSYVASFFAFSLWTGIGATGLLQLVRDAFHRSGAELKSRGIWMLGAVVFACVPGWMAIENYNDHDRSGRYVAPEYAHNMLMSLAPNAIVFTNGDNDTFPLWYAQEVEGIRRDVRVANLSLLNTPWYVRQLKNQASRESAPVPISLSEEEIQELAPVGWIPRTMILPVDKAQIMQDSEVFAGQSDIADFDSIMQWELIGRPWGRHPETGEDLSILYGADLAALDILQTNAAQGWKRPIYFAVTVSPDGRLDLPDFFQLEGQANRVVPIRHNQPLGRIDPQVSPERLKAFKFTNLDNPKVYYDANIRKMVDNYRNVYAQTAIALIGNGQLDEGLALMDLIMERIPFSTIPGDVSSFLFMAEAFRTAGERDRVVEILKTAEPLVLHRLNRAGSQAEMNYVSQFAQRMLQNYLQARDFEAAAAFDNQLRELRDDPSRISADEFRQMIEGIPLTDTLYPEVESVAEGDGTAEDTMEQISSQTDSVSHPE